MDSLEEFIQKRISRLFKSIYKIRYENQKIFDENTNLLDRKFKNLELSEDNKYLKESLKNYLSLALTNTHYYGNLRIRYVSFNFTFLALLVYH